VQEKAERKINGQTSMCLEAELI